MAVTDIKIIAGSIVCLWDHDSHITVIDIKNRRIFSDDDEAPRIKKRIFFNAHILSNNTFH